MYIIGAMVTVGAVLKDQADADPDLSMKQRLILAGGSTLEGASEFVPDEVGAGVLQVAGELGFAIVYCLLLRCSDQFLNSDTVCVDVYVQARFSSYP